MWASRRNPTTRSAGRRAKNALFCVRGGRNELAGRRRGLCQGQEDYGSRFADRRRGEDGNHWDPLGAEKERLTQVPFVLAALDAPILPEHDGCPTVIASACSTAVRSGTAAAQGSATESSGACHCDWP